MTIVGGVREQNVIVFFLFIFKDVYRQFPLGEKFVSVDRLDFSFFSWIPVFAYGSELVHLLRLCSALSLISLSSFFRKNVHRHVRLCLVL